MKRSCSSTSSVHTLPPSPNGLSFASDTACSRLSTRNNSATGPKISSRNAGARSGMLASTPGRNQLPGPLETLRPRQTPRARVDRALDPARPRRRALDASASGPISVAVIHGITHSQGQKRAHQAGLEAIVNVRVHEESLRVDARLAVVERARLDRGAERGVEDWPRA